MVTPQFSHTITKEFKTIWDKIFSNTITVHEDTYTIYLCVLLNNTPISCCEIIEIDPENYLIDSIGVLKEIRHQQIAQYTLRFAETKIREIGGFNSLVRISPDYESHYKKLSYKEHLGGEILMDNNIPKIEMKKVLRVKKSRK